MAKIWPVDPKMPDDAVIFAAAEVIRRGGVLVLPTHGLYGLGGSAFNESVIERIFKMKGRSASKALLVLIADIQDLTRLAEAPSALATHMMQHFWPGGVTFVINAHQELPPSLTGNSGKIGVRLVGHPVAATLIREAGTPLTGTSANISGAGGCDSVDQIDADIINGADMVLDAGQLAGGPGSTVVGITGPVPEILREGSVSGHEIMACYKEFSARSDFPK